MNYQKLYTSIVSLSPSTLNEIDVERFVESIPNDHYKGFFRDKAGQEHYRFLIEVSNLTDNLTIIDLGTHMGCSALALSANITNTIHSFDVVDRFGINNSPENCSFYLENILETSNKNLIPDADIIMMDTYHNGDFEQEVYEYLQSIDWKGILLLDDIHLNPEMDKFWDGIHHTKQDVKGLAHFTGTGVVLFN
jgi:predicted nicotinamide N-methyase